MSDLTSVSELVETTLAERAIRFERRKGSVLCVPHGSAEITISFDDLAGGTVIRVGAVVLDQLDLQSEVEGAALRAVNDRNRTIRFGKFMLELDNDSITLEYDILGDFLQPEELINAVTSVAQMADEQDDLLQAELGAGRRAADR